MVPSGIKKIEKKILIIEDDNGAIDLLVRYLSEIFPSAKIDFSSDGNSGLRKLTHNKFDLVCTDFQLPGSSGSALINHVKTNKAMINHCTPFLVITGYLELAKDQILGDFKDIFFLEKPFSIDSLRVTATAASFSNHIDMVALKERIGHLEKLSSIGELSGILVHELNNPLHIIRGNRDIICKKLSKNFPLAYQAVEKELTDILSYSDKLNEIVTHFKHFIKNDNQLNSIFELNSILDSPFISLFIKEHEEQIKVSFESQEPSILVKGHRGQIEQAILHLLTNSAQAIKESAPETNGQIRVTTEISKHHAILHVTDNGCGVPAQIKEEIFRPFFSAFIKPGLSGLGLSVSQRMIEQNGGNLLLETNSQENTTFSIYLPLSL